MNFPKKSLQIGRDIFISQIDDNEFFDGYLPVAKYLPTTFELIKLKDELDSNPVSGWSNGKEFYGYRVDKKKIYKYWKNNTTHY